MKKILFILSFIFSLNIQAQQPVIVYQIKDTLTAFTQPVSKSKLVLDTTQKVLYLLLQKVDIGQKLSQVRTKVIGGSNGTDTTSTWLNPVLSIANEPLTKDSADRYIALSTAGTWTINKIYEWNGTAWDSTTPVIGNAVIRIDSAKQLIYTASGWVTNTTTPSLWQASGINMFPTIAGKVLIGTTIPVGSPTYKLEVKGSIYSSAHAVHQGFIFGSNSSAVALGSESMGSIKFLTYNTLNSYKLQLNSGSVHGGYIDLRTGGKQALSIDSNQNLVIGDTAANTYYRLPKTDGTANQTLKTDGNHQVSWADASGGGSLAKTIFVVDSINGGRDASGDGTLSKPYATLNKAKTMANNKGFVTVWVEAGNYTPTANLAQDSTSWYFDNNTTITSTMLTNLFDYTGINTKIEIRGKAIFNLASGLIITNTNATDNNIIEFDKLTNTIRNISLLLYCKDLTINANVINVSAPAQVYLCNVTLNGTWNLNVKTLNHTGVSNYTFQYDVASGSKNVYYNGDVNKTTASLGMFGGIYGNWTINGNWNSLGNVINFGAMQSFRYNGTLIGNISNEYAYAGYTEFNGLIYNCTFVNASAFYTDSPYKINSDCFNTVINQPIITLGNRNRYVINGNCNYCTFNNATPYQDNYIAPQYLNKINNAMVVNGVCLQPQISSSNVGIIEFNNDISWFYNDASVKFNIYGKVFIKNLRYNLMTTTNTPCINVKENSQLVINGEVVYDQSNGNNTSSIIGLEASSKLFLNGCRIRSVSNNWNIGGIVASGNSTIIANGSPTIYLATPAMNAITVNNGITLTTKLYSNLFTNSAINLVGTGAITNAITTNSGNITIDANVE